MATVSIPATDDGRADGAKPPFLRRVRVRGYKSIEYCDVYLQPLTFLVGRNAAGKSNFLDALAFLRDIVADGLPSAVKAHGGSDAIPCRRMSATRTAIAIEADFAGQEPGSHWTAAYRVEVDFANRLQPRITSERLRLATDNGVRWTEYSVRDSRVTWSGDSYGHPITEWGAADRVLLGAYGVPPFLDLLEMLLAVGTYNFVPDAIRQLQKPLGTMLERDGCNLASALENLNEIDPPSVDRARDYLRTIVEDVERFDVVRYGEFQTVRFRLRAATGEPPVELDAASMSDGTLRALAALVAAFQLQFPVDPSVVGIEEPETALHPAALRALVDALDDATQRTQIIVTTHSPDILSGRDVHPGQVLVVRSRGGRTQIAPVDRASREIIARELYSLAELQRMDKLDLDESDLERQSQLSQHGDA